MVDYIFRQYDIRAKIGPELAVDEVYALVQAIAVYFKQIHPDITAVAVGADGRVHSPAIKHEVCRALQDAGLQVIFIGLCPTPTLYFSLHQLVVDAGLMITASHNGKEYNGIKICLKKESVWGSQIQAIKKLCNDGATYIAPERGVYQENNMVEPYIAWLAHHFSHLQYMNLTAVVDCGNGAAGAVLPRLIEVMQWKGVQLLCSEVDGTYPNHEADPTQEENMQDVRKALAATTISIGIGLDGDADRMTPMTQSGELIFGDKLLTVFARAIIKNNAKFTVVYDSKCSSGLPELLNVWGITPHMSPTGHSIIKMNMKKYKALLGGELSCHFFFADRYFGYDDGIYAMMRLFEILCDTGMSLEALLKEFPKKVATPEIRFACSELMQSHIIETVTQHFERQGVQISTLDGIRVIWKHGWGMLRSSHTQPVLCARFEANSYEELQNIKDAFIEVLVSFYDRAYLQAVFLCN